MRRKRYLRTGHIPHAFRSSTGRWNIRGLARTTSILMAVAVFVSLQLAVLLRPDIAEAAVLSVVSAAYEGTDLTTVSTTYVDTGNANTEIPSGSLPAGTYFVAWGAAAGYGINGNTADVRLVRGASTEIAETVHESGAATTSVQGPSRSGYWLGALSGSERLAIQFQGHGNTVYLNSTFIKAIRLDAELVADTDYFTSGSQEDASTFDLENAPTAAWGTTRTLTKTFSSYDTEEYLLFGSMEIAPNDTAGANNDCLARINVDGTPIMESRMQAEDPKDRQGYTAAKLVSIGTGSKSISLEGQSVGSALCDYTRSRIYVFRATAFDQVLEDYSSAESTTTQSGDNWVDKNSQSYTPNQSETVMTIGSHARSSGAGNCSTATRLDDGTTQVGSKQGYIPNASATDYFINMTAASWSVSSATTFKKQFQRGAGTCTVQIKESTLLIWSMTLRDDATYSQSAYRWFANATTPLAAANTAHTLAAAGDNFRLRMLLHVANNDLPTGSVAFKLQYAVKSGTCDTGYSGETYGDVGTASGAIRYHDNAGAADGSAMAPDADDPTHGSDTVLAQTYEEANNFTSTSRIGLGQDGKWEFALVDFSAPTDTAYCFRVVLADGSAIATPGVVPEIVTAPPTNTVPDAPTSLTQTKTDDTVLATGVWTNETSIKLTATVTDPDSDTVRICAEVDPIATAFSSPAGDGDGCSASAVASGGTATVTISGLSDNTQYHWQIKTKDSVGAYSSWVSYDVNLETAADFGTDTSAPTGGTVYDGTEAGVDKSFSDTSLSALSANWSGFNFNVSLILRYDYSIGTTQGGTDVKGWTSNTTATSVTATSLTLQTSRVYYVNVRAYDNAGNFVERSSDGQLVAPSVSFSVSPATLTFDNLNTGNGHTDTKTTTLSTSTNAYGGYVVRLAATDYLRSGSFTIPDFNGGSYASPDSWQIGDLGFGYTSSDADIQGVNKFQSSTCPGGSALAAPGCYAPYTQTRPGDIVADHIANVTGAPISNEQFTITHRATVSPAQAAAPYSAVLVYTITVLY